jgi:hypothetical protein
MRASLSHSAAKSFARPDEIQMLLEELRLHFVKSQGPGHQGSVATQPVLRNPANKKRYPVATSLRCDEFSMHRPEILELKHRVLSRPTLDRSRAGLNVWDAELFKSCHDRKLDVLGPS